MVMVGTLHLSFRREVGFSLLLAGGCPEYPVRRGQVLNQRFFHAPGSHRRRRTPPADPADESLDASEVFARVDPPGNGVNGVTLRPTGADKDPVPWISGPQPAPTWLYMRQGESVRIEVRDHGSSYGLIVHGPGHRRRLIECQDPWAVIDSQLAEETHLLALGYMLERFTSDRRRLLPRGRPRPATAGKILSHRERTRS